MQVEIWSDVVCPWCYIGKRRFETALNRFGHRDDVSVTWRSFELDPYAPAVQEGPPAARLAEKYGISEEQARAGHERLGALAAEEGLDFHLASARSGNTFDAHRLIHLAADFGLQDQMKERLFSAYMVEEEAIGDRDTLIRLAAEVGIEKDRAAAALDSDEFGAEVRADESQARRFGVSGVPFFVFDRKYAVSGAQSAEHFDAALAQAWQDAQGLTMVVTPTGDEGGACEGDNCPV